MVSGEFVSGELKSGELESGELVLGGWKSCELTGTRQKQPLGCFSVSVEVSNTEGRVYPSGFLPFFGGHFPLA